MAAICEGDYERHRIEIRTNVTFCTIADSPCCRVFQPAAAANLHTNFSGHFTETVEKRVSDGVRRLEKIVSEQPE